MPNSYYQRAAAKERETVRMLRSYGWESWRTPASKGGLDVLGLKYDPEDDQSCKGCGRLPTQLVEVKSGKSKTPWGIFPPDEREAFINLARRLGYDNGNGHRPCRPWLAWYPLRESLVRVEPEMFPGRDES
jgi:hypothetical protein